MKNHLIGFAIAGVLLTAAYSVSVSADGEGGAICCATTADCTDSHYPTCMSVGVDCDGPNLPQNHYCMAEKEN